MLDSIREWDWHNLPLSLLSQREERIWLAVDCAIYDASSYECESSPSLYIRECKLWFETSPIEDLIHFFTYRRGIEFKDWSGSPASSVTEDYIFNSFRLMSSGLYQEDLYTPSDKTLREQAKVNYSIFCTVDNLIKSSNDTIALSSPLEYVRECKKWFMLNDKT